MNEVFQFRWLHIKSNLTVDKHDRAANSRRSFSYFVFLFDHFTYHLRRLSVAITSNILVNSNLLFLWVCFVSLMELIQTFLRFISSDEIYSNIIIYSSECTSFTYISFHTLCSVSITAVYLSLYFSENSILLLCKLLMYIYWTILDLHQCSCWVCYIFFILFLSLLRLFHFVVTTFCICHIVSSEGRYCLVTIFSWLSSFCLRPILVSNLISEAAMTLYYYIKHVVKRVVADNFKIFSKQNTMTKIVI